MWIQTIHCITSYQRKVNYEKLCIHTSNVAGARLQSNTGNRKFLTTGYTNRIILLSICYYVFTDKEWHARKIPKNTIL